MELQSRPDHPRSFIPMRLLTTLLQLHACLAPRMLRDLHDRKQSQGESIKLIKEAGQDRPGP